MPSAADTPHGREEWLALPLITSYLQREREPRGVFVKVCQVSVVYDWLVKARKVHFLRQLGSQCGLPSTYEATDGDEEVTAAVSLVQREQALSLV